MTQDYTMPDGLDAALGTAPQRAKDLQGPALERVQAQAREYKTDNLERLLRQAHQWRNALQEARLYPGGHPDEVYNLQYDLWCVLLRLANLLIKVYEEAMEAQLSPGLEELAEQIGDLTNEGRFRLLKHCRDKRKWRGLRGLDDDDLKRLSGF